VLPDAPPAVHAAHQAHGSANTTSPVTQARVDTPVRDPAFGQEFSQKIVWLAGQDKQSAQLTLNPPQLGPVEVSLKISGDQATAVFSSPHAEVREAIEAALPRLREMMGSAGLELGQANVSSQSFQQQQQQQAAQNQAGASRGGSTGGILGEGGNEPAAATGTVIRQSNGLVDTFA
jgi:flagellar hook-length control protein FliK